MVDNLKKHNEQSRGEFESREAGPIPDKMANPPQEQRRNNNEESDGALEDNQNRDQETKVIVGYFLVVFEDVEGGDLFDGQLRVLFILGRSELLDLDLVDDEPDERAAQDQKKQDDMQKLIQFSTDLDLTHLQHHLYGCHHHKRRKAHRFGAEQVEKIVEARLFN